MADYNSLKDRYRVLTMAETISYAGSDLSFNIDWLYDFYQCEERRGSWA